MLNALPSIRSYAPRFGSMTRHETYTDPKTSQQLVLDQSCYFFRDPQGNAQAIKVLKQFFPHGCKVQVYGGSDGSDAYTLALALNNTLGQETVSKLYPIESIDISAERTRIAQSGVIGISQFDVKQIQKYVAQEASAFAAPLENPNNEILDEGQNDQMDRKCDLKPIQHFSIREWTKKAYQFFSILPTMRSQVKFKVGDIREQADQRFEEPTMLFCKHFLGQLSTKEQNKVIDDLKRNLKPGSVFVLGDTEKQSTIASKLYRAGFHTYFSPDGKPNELTGLMWFQPKAKP